MKKKIFLTFIILLSVLCIIILSINTIKEDNKISFERDYNTNDLSKEEYIYKEELLELKYTEEDIVFIANNVNNMDVKNYLLTKKYNNLINFLASPYAKVQNIERYQNYFNSGNHSYEEAVMNVEIGLDYDFYTHITEANTSLGQLVLVNKYYKLPSNYLVTLANVEKDYGTGKLEINTYNHFKQMADAAKIDGVTLKSKSAYRTYDTQKKLYNNYVKDEGVKEADTYSARAGHSEHNTGYAIDINCASRSCNFQKKAPYKWLKENAYKYGFIERYPEDKVHITGYIYEPWHWRYVGVEAATKIYEENITFEEYHIKYLNQ